MRARRLRPIDDRNVRVLTYHGVLETKFDERLERNFHTLAQFRAHLDVLEHYDVIAVDEVLADHRTRRRPPVVLTFDDGYRNNQLVAELLDERGLPWSLFVATDVIGSRRTIWTAELALLLLFGRAEQVEFDGHRYPLTDQARREASYDAIRRSVKALPQHERRIALEGIRSQFPDGEDEALLDRFPGFEMLTWDEIAQFSTDCEVGSHGVDHEILHAGQPIEVVEHELRRSRDEIRNRLGRACTTFAYPNGDHSAESRRQVAESGYALAFTTIDGLVRADDDPHLLARVSAMGEQVDFAQALLVGSATGF